MLEKIKPYKKIVGYIFLIVSFIMIYKRWDIFDELSKGITTSIDQLILPTALVIAGLILIFKKSKNNEN